MLLDPVVCLFQSAYLYLYTLNGIEVSGHTQKEREHQQFHFNDQLYFQSINQSIHRSWREEECKRGRGVFLILMPPTLQHREEEAEEEEPLYTEKEDEAGTEQEPESGTE